MLSPVPVALVHMGASAQTRVSLRWWASSVVVISTYRAVVVISGDCGSGVVWNSNLPVRTVQCGTIDSHTRHREAPINGMRV